MFLDRVFRLLYSCASIASLLIVGFVTLSAVMRYLIGQPIAMTEELVGLLFCTLLFLSLPSVTAANAHIRLGVVQHLLPAKINRPLLLIGEFLTLAFTVQFGILSWGFMDFSRQVGATAEVSGLLLWPWMALMPLSAGLVAVSIVMRILGSLRHKDPVE